jgi:hypothetical protein
MNVLLYGSISRLLFQTEYIRISFPVVSIVSLFSFVFLFTVVENARGVLRAFQCHGDGFHHGRQTIEADGGQQMWRDVPKRLSPLPALTDSTQQPNTGDSAAVQQKIFFFSLFSFFLFEGAMHRWCAAQHEMGRHRGKRRTTPGHFIAIPPPSFSH